MTEAQRIEARAQELVTYYRKHGEWPNLQVTQNITEWTARNRAAKIVHAR
jgi:hypothetical protein